MLIKLTNRCFEGCSHCMEDSNPDGCHMSWDVVKDVASFASAIESRVLVISGGEFTTDPEFYDKIKYLIVNCTSTIGINLQSNGWWIENNDIRKQLFKLLNQDKITGIQISTNKHYYPNYEFIEGHKEDFTSFHRKVFYASNWQGSMTNITRLGRASNLPDSAIKGYPGCSPFLQRSQMIERTLFKPINEIRLKEIIQSIEYSGILCKPMIDEFGVIHIGETQFCTPVGDVLGFSSISNVDKNNRMEGIKYSIYEARMCDRCRQVKNLARMVGPTGLPSSILSTKRFR